MKEKDTIYKAKLAEGLDDGKTNNSNRNQVNYEVSFPKRDIDGIIYIKAKLTYNNGVEYTKDITEDITMGLQDLEK